MTCPVEIHIWHELCARRASVGVARHGRACIAIRAARCVARAAARQRNVPLGAIFRKRGALEERRKTWGHYPRLASRTCWRADRFAPGYANRAGTAWSAHCRGVQLRHRRQCLAWAIAHRRARSNRGHRHNALDCHSGLRARPLAQWHYASALPAVSGCALGLCHELLHDGLPGISASRNHPLGNSYHCRGGSADSGMGMPMTCSRSCRSSTKPSFSATRRLAMLSGEVLQLGRRPRR